MGTVLSGKICIDVFDIDMLQECKARSVYFSTLP